MLKVSNLSAGYDGRQIIKGVSFYLAEGDFLGIIGPNGAGKTTLFRAITRIIKPWAGEVKFREKNIFDYRIKDLAKELAVLPQEVLIPFAFRVEEFVCLGRFPYLDRLASISDKDLDVARHSMELTDTIHLRDRKINEISQGERQRVFLAQALSQEPKLLLLDEPTAHLDITHQVQVLNLLKKLNKEQGLTVAMIVHDLNLASEYCKELILLNKGEIYKHGVSRDVLTYETIEEVYKTVVIVKENPLSGKPYVFVVPQEGV